MVFKTICILKTWIIENDENLILHFKKSRKWKITKLDVGSLLQREGFQETACKDSIPLKSTQKKISSISASISKILRKQREQNLLLIINVALSLSLSHTHTLPVRRQIKNNDSCCLVQQHHCKVKNKI